MATGTYAPDPFEQMCDDDGNPLSSGTLTTFLAGLSTPATTYSDVNLTVANTNPISLDAAGRPTSGAIFLTPGVSYKFILKDSLGATVATRDNIAAVPLNPNVTGTWIPVIGGSTSESGQTYSLQTGSYVKLGALVIASFNAVLSAKGSINGAVVIKGLPFAHSGSDTATFPFGAWVATTTAYVWMGFQMQGSLSQGFVVGITAASTTNSINVLAADISDTTEFAGTIIYSTTS